MRYLCCETAFFGQPAEEFFEGRDILADILTMYFTDFEPESLFIAEIDGVRIGYLTGNKNINRLKKIFKSRILPAVIVKSLIAGVIFRKKNLVFFLKCAKSFFRRELFDPDFSRQFPATLHVNVDASYRNMKVGEKLIDQYCNYLRKVNIRGVFLTTVSRKGSKIFSEDGFFSPA